MAHFAYGKLSGKRYGKRHSKPYDTKRWIVGALTLDIDSNSIRVTLMFYRLYQMRESSRYRSSLVEVRYGTSQGCREGEKDVPAG